MKKAMSAVVCLGCTAIAFLTLPSACEAQFRVRVGGGNGFYSGSPYYGNPYYGRSYYGGGYGYSPGAYYGPSRGGVGVIVGGNPGYGGYGYGNGYYSQSGVVVGTPSTYQSFYPSTSTYYRPNVIYSSPVVGRGRVFIR